MEDWNPISRDDLLKAHASLMVALVDDTGQFRSSGVGVFQGEQLVHMAPPAGRVPQLMDDFLDWLKNAPRNILWSPVASFIMNWSLSILLPTATTS